MFGKLFAVCSLLIMIIFVSCSDDNNPVGPKIEIKGSGNIVSEERVATPFHSVDFTTVGNVHITSGASQLVTINVDDNVMEHIFTTVSNGVLKVSSNPNANLSEFELDVYLTMTDLEKVTLTGVGNIVGTNTFLADTVELTLDGVGNIVFNLDSDMIYAMLEGVGNFNLNLETNRLMSALNGVGNINLEGSTPYHQCVHTSTGAILAFNLITDTSFVVQTAVGHTEVYVNDYMNVIISGLGSVYYKGHPTIDVTVSGTGQVINAN